MLSFEEAQRIKNLPPYLFARIEKLIAEKRQAGIDVISLGIGDPDLPTPPHIIKALQEQAENTVNHQYPSSAGMLEFRQAVAQWYQNKYDINLDAATEVVTLIGSKEGIGHISWCYLNAGDVVLVPDPGYPVYAGGAILAGAEPYYMPLREENNFLPDLKAIPEQVAQKAKMMFINYPNNPTGAVADDNFYRQVIDFAQRHRILVCHDAAYSEMAYDGYQPPSFLQYPGAKEVGIEFNSLSKGYNMTGWRIGWAAGHPQVIEALGRLKSNIDSGQFQAVQYAGIAGLTGPQDHIGQLQQIYTKRRNLIVDGLNDMGWQLKKPQATFYVWAPVPAGHTSESFTELVLEKAGVVITPGSGYGECGAGYFRIALTVTEERAAEALQKMKDNIGQVSF